MHPRPSLTLFLIAMLCCSTAVTSKLRGANVSWNNPVTFTEPGLTHHSYQSAAMSQETGYSVWLPPGYETSAERYPVIYFLHGAGGTESADAPAFSQMLAARLRAGKIPAAICVFPNGGLSGYRDVATDHLNVETMIVRELIPRIDQAYRTRTDRSSRTIGGFSMGGGGAVHLALKYPELFSAAASWAGGFARHDEGGRDTPFFEDHALVNPAAPLRLLLIVGYEDLTFPWHAPVLSALQDAKYPFTLHTIAGLAHDLGRYYELTGDEFIEWLTRDFARR